MPRSAAALDTPLSPVALGVSCAGRSCAVVKCDHGEMRGPMLHEGHHFFGEYHVQAGAVLVYSVALDGDVGPYDTLEAPLPWQTLCACLVQCGPGR